MTFNEVRRPGSEMVERLEKNSGSGNKKKSLKHFQVLTKKQARHVAEWNSNGL